MSNLKIDWVNHLIGFLTALVGIIIAFQLDGWQERNREREKVKLTLEAVKIEIDNNREIYRRDVTVLSDWLEYWHFMRTYDEDNNGEIVATDRKIELMKKKYPNRFGSLKLIRKFKDSLNVYGPLFAQVDVIANSGISTSSWDAAKSSGVFSSLDHTRMTELTKIYDWINKDLGITDADVIRNTNGFDSEFSDLEKILHDYKMIVRVYSYKLNEIDKHYKVIDWNVK